MKKIKDLRKLTGITQEKLAKIMGVTQGTISQWEKGVTHPGFDKLERLSSFLGVTVDELITIMKK